MLPSGRRSEEWRAEPFAKVMVKSWGRMTVRFAGRSWISSGGLPGVTMRVADMVRFEAARTRACSGV